MKVRDRLIVPMYHPAAGLHQRSLMSAIEEDFARLPDWIDQAAQIPEYHEDDSDNNGGTDQATQLSMF